MKNQALFSSKDKSKKLKCHLLQVLFGTLRVKQNILKLIHADIDVDADKYADVGADTGITTITFHVISCKEPKMANKILKPFADTS